MKKLFLTLAAVSALTFTSIAQDAKKQGTASEQAPLTPEQRADKETTKATTALSLNEDQKAKFKTYALDRIRSNRALREKAKASTDKTEKQKLHQEAKANNDKFYNNVNSILNADQQVKWADHKKKQEAKKAADKQHED